MGFAQDMDVGLTWGGVGAACSVGLPVVLKCRGCENHACGLRIGKSVEAEVCAEVLSTVTHLPDEP